MDVAIVAASKHLSEILNHPMPTSGTSEQELDPRALNLCTDAKKLLFEYYQATETAQARDGCLERLKSFASKSPEQAARIAGVLTLWTNIGASVVSEESMKDAILLAQFYLMEAKRLSEAALISDEIDRADKLRLWLLDSWPEIARKQDRDPQTIVPRDVVILGPNSLRETVKVKKLMKVLEGHGWLVALDPETIVDGQSRQISYKILRAR